jgi:hypothetical protein
MIGHQNNAEDIGYPLSQIQKPGFYLGFDRLDPLMSPASEDNAVSLVAQGDVAHFKKAGDAAIDRKMPFPVGSTFRIPDRSGGIDTDRFHPFFYFPSCQTLKVNYC